MPALLFIFKMPFLKDPLSPKPKPGRRELSSHDFDKLVRCQIELSIDGLKGCPVLPSHSDHPRKVFRGKEC
jgi:hypothetical protein